MTKIRTLMTQTQAMKLNQEKKGQRTTKPTVGLQIPFIYLWVLLTRTEVSLKSRSLQLSTQREILQKQWL